MKCLNGFYELFQLLLSAVARRDYKDHEVPLAGSHTVAENLTEFNQ